MARSRSKGPGALAALRGASSTRSSELVLARRVRLLVRCGLRARPREAYRDLNATFPPRDTGNASKSLKKKHPWLLGE